MLFRNLPIRRKLRAVILLTSGIVLFLTCLAFIGYELITFRRAAVENLTTLGEIIAENSTASLAFRNQNDGQRLLSSLHLENNIIGAALYDAEGKLFVQYPPDVTADVVARQPGSDGVIFKNRQLILFQTATANEVIITIKAIWT